MTKRSAALLDEVTVVIVMYNSADVVGACLESLPGEVDLILVDNASSDDGVARAREVRTDALVLHSHRNVGFGGGCNLGWRAATKSFVAFVNPDVRMQDNALGVLLERLEGTRHFVVGPSLIDRFGAPRRCKRRPSVVADAIGLLPASTRWARPGWDGKLRPDDPVHYTGGVVACVEGACFVARRDDLQTIGGFDEDFFLYYEEESIALRLARLGGGAVYEPRAVVDHAGAASTRKVGPVATRQVHRSRVIFYRKRDGNLRGELTALALMFAVLVSLPGAAVNSLLGRRRTTTLGHVGHVMGGLAAGMTARLGTEVSYVP